MKKSKFTEQQTASILKEVEIGSKVNETCRKKYGFSDATCTSGNRRIMPGWRFPNCVICKQRSPLDEDVADLALVHNTTDGVSEEATKQHTVLNYAFLSTRKDG